MPSLRKLCNKVGLRLYENKPVQRLTIGNNAQELQRTPSFKVMLCILCSNLKTLVQWWHLSLSPIIMKEDMEYKIQKF